MRDGRSVSVRRRVLLRINAVFAIAGVAALAAFFAAALGPAADAKYKYELSVPLSDLPENGTYDVEWQGYKAFVVMPERSVVLFAYSDGTYWLQDPWAKRVSVGCLEIALRDDLFQCVDADGWRRNAFVWRRDGSPAREGLAALDRPPTLEQGGQLIIGRFADE